MRRRLLVRVHAEGCAIPRCVAVGRCETDRACEEGEVQLCEHGVWAPTCEVAE
ncbi:MAG: hypothetical protein H6722_01790 [Sandaracinus sp.]|nr:hypothetical protein [Sandaracinus sp.]